MAAISLQARRRELIAAYSGARRHHAASATLGQHLFETTCQVLKAEIRAARATSKPASPQTDLFAHLGATPP